MKYVSRLMIALALVSTCVLSASLTSAQTEDVRAAVEAGNQEWIAAFTRGDGSAIAGLYTATAKVFPPVSEVVQGRDAIARFWQGAIDSGIKGGDRHHPGSRGLWRYGLRSGHLQPDGRGLLDAGKYVVVWKKEDGKWKLHRDIWNTNMPPSKP